MKEAVLARDAYRAGTITLGDYLAVLDRFLDGNPLVDRLLADQSAAESADGLGEGKAIGLKHAIKQAPEKDVKKESQK